MSIFEDIRVQETEQLERLGREIETKQRELAMARRVLALRGAAGWQEFVKSVEKLRLDALAQMSSCMASNDYLRYLQGRAQALLDILALLTRSENLAQLLEVQIMELQDRVKIASKPKRGRS